MVPSPSAPAQQSSVQWSAPSFDASSGHPKAPFILMGIFLIVIIYALVENSPIMAITFVLFGTVTYLQSRKAPKTLDCRITNRDVIAGNEAYAFENIASFWIIYEPGCRSLFLQTSGLIAPSVRVPLGDADPSRVRDALLAAALPEKPYEPTLVDTLSNFLHI